MKNQCSALYQLNGACLALDHGIMQQTQPISLNFGLRVSNVESLMNPSILLVCVEMAIVSNTKIIAFFLHV
jgi:hypothetical protein